MSFLKMMNFSASRKFGIRGQLLASAFVLLFSLKHASAETVDILDPVDGQETSVLCKIEKDRESRERQDLNKMRQNLSKHKACKEIATAMEKQDLALKHFIKVRSSLCAKKTAASQEMKDGLQKKLEESKKGKSSSATDSCNSFDTAKEMEKESAGIAAAHKQRVKENFKALWKEIREASELTSDAIDLFDDKKCGSAAAKKDALNKGDKTKTTLAQKVELKKDLKDKTGPGQPKKEGALKSDFKALFVNKESYFGKLLVAVKAEESLTGLSKKNLDSMAGEMKVAREKCKSAGGSGEKNPASKGAKNCYFEFSSSNNPSLDQMKKMKSEKGSCAMVGVDISNNPKKVIADAKKAGIDSHIYLEGPGGPTGAKWNPQELQRMKNQAASIGISGPNWMKEWDRTGWLTYTRKQIKEFDDLGVRSYEIDNIERVIGTGPEKTVAFFQDQQKWMEDNNIQTKLMLKNQVGGRMEAVESAIGDGSLKRSTFSDFAIVEVSKKAKNKEDDNGFPVAWGEKSAAISSRVGIQTVFSYNTYDYKAKGSYSAR